MSNFRAINILMAVPVPAVRPQFEAVSRFDPEEKKIVKALLEGIILKHEAKRIANISQ